jgi:hypothetical protein
MKDKDFRNMINDPYLYRNCCGGAMLGATGSADIAPPPAKTFTLSTVLMLVGLTAVGVYAFTKFIK